MDESEKKELLATALEVAREGAALIQEGHRQKKVTAAVTHHKGATDLVTDYDRACEELLRARLLSRTPHPVTGEEFGGADESESIRWLVDPIDGTTNYVHGHPFYCVSIGLVENGLPVLGAIVAPALAHEWTGIVGAGSFRDGVPIVVSTTEVFGKSLLATGFPYERSEAHPDFVAFERIKMICQAVRRCGSAALDLALVADGTYEGYWERRIKPWDAAAGAAIVLGAGGRLSRYDGSPFDVMKGDLVATNGHIHGELLAPLKEIADSIP